MNVHTRHRLLDVSTYAKQHFICECGHWTLKAPWTWQLDYDAAFEDHLAAWNAAELELDAVE